MDEHFHIYENKKGVYFANCVNFGCIVKGHKCIGCNYIKPLNQMNMIPYFGSNNSELRSERLTYDNFKNLGLYRYLFSLY